MDLTTLVLCSIWQYAWFDYFGAIFIFDLAVCFVYRWWRGVSGGVVTNRWFGCIEGFFHDLEWGEDFIVINFLLVMLAISFAIFGYLDIWIFCGCFLRGSWEFFFHVHFLGQECLVSGEIPSNRGFRRAGHQGSVDFWSYEVANQGKSLSWGNR